MSERKQPLPVQPERNKPLSTSVPKDVGSVPALIGVPNIRDDDAKAFINSIYEAAINMTEEEIKVMYDMFRYQGFDRDEVLKQLAIINNQRTIIELILVCALRGPQAASMTVLSNGRTPIQLGIPASGGQGRKVLTCNKITAATADLAAFYMKKMNVPKRILSDCPGWLQFPSAGSIKMPEAYRQMHIDFSRRFSTLIGGNFQENIYGQMVANAYLDPRLNLF